MFSCKWICICSPRNQIQISCQSKKIFCVVFFSYFYSNKTKEKFLWNSSNWKLCTDKGRNRKKNCLPDKTWVDEHRWSNYERVVSVVSPIWQKQKWKIDESRLLLMMILIACFHSNREKFVASSDWSDAKRKQWNYWNFENRPHTFFTPRETIQIFFHPFNNNKNLFFLLWIANVVWCTCWSFINSSFVNLKNTAWKRLWVVFLLLRESADPPSVLLKKCTRKVENVRQISAFMWT